MPGCYPDTIIWPDESVLPDDLPDDADELEQVAHARELLDIEIATARAWSTLQVLSAYQISICPVTVRPCKASCRDGSYFTAPLAAGPGHSPFFPRVRNGVWTNVWCGHTDDCSCTGVRKIALTAPVGGIASVVIDGEPLPTDAYRIDNGVELVRQDGDDWPTCQDMNLPAGSVGTFEVTYYHGATADLLVRYAAGTLATEYLQAQKGLECRLPSGTVSVVRQGVTIEMQADLFENGMTGILEVDSVIARYNPYHAKMPAAMFSLDRLPPRQTVGGYVPTPMPAVEPTDFIFPDPDNQGYYLLDTDA